MADQFIGPILPQHLLGNDSSGNETDSASVETSEADSYFGPKLPSSLLNRKENEISNEDDEVIGPVLPTCSGNTSAAQAALEERAQILKYEFLLKNSKGQEVPKREEWMTELPPEKAVNLGLGPRKFRKSYPGDKRNRKGWTETPSDKNKNEELDETEEAEEFEMASIERRNRVMDEIVKKSKSDKKKEKSLLDLHTEKLKKKMKKKKKKSKKEEKQERRPFNREVDLQVHRFDEAQKKAIIKKSQLLDTRFGAGKSKYL